MNRLASILSPAQVLAQVEVTSKKRAFEEAGLVVREFAWIEPSTGGRQSVLT
jgi:hypothetical protein